MTVLVWFGVAILGGLLYRLRGGLWKTLTGGDKWWNGTHACRALWALPTAFMLAGTEWVMFGLLSATFFLSMALIGHGAHMVYGPAYFTHVKDQDELLTSWWLPKLWGGHPANHWDQYEVDNYNMVGMSVIGLVRNTLAISPLIWMDPFWSFVYAMSGLLHGPLYNLGWTLTPNIKAAEVMVGGVSWLLLFWLFV